MKTENASAKLITAVENGKLVILCLILAIFRFFAFKTLQLVRH